ncbi:hypothetical protein GCM10010168_82840 [Actinoplanes ianthinogenes]|uniref:DUF4082 domain-containing protein n=1 Tax=Actinoplanes ianthinogenes TaxID=122358 RepID=UPI0019AE3F92|nr:N,N-dimethylformamidase beta subunit family domain-containing protein [Actinoplanes ianthinogenes]GGR51423.1 hypothetical protein GCM10010168_82840 [Actinoplanes ianthinogenes]
MKSKIIAGAISALIAGAVIALPGVVLAADDPCGVNSNPIVCENSKPGTPLDDWYTDASWGDIGGFTTKVSYQPGETMKMKVTSPGHSFGVTIYRLGYYGGNGARKMPTSPTTTFPAKDQGGCDSDATGLVDCGKWAVNVTWTVPSDAVSGVYLAVLDTNDGAGYMPYPFVVANDNSHSDVLVQTSDETWQAYNKWGGQNLYDGAGPGRADGRAYKVSYNRPLRIAGDNSILGSEYPMIYWLERNGYDTSYASNIDVSTKPALLPKHKVYLSSGHDEYWDQGIWNNVKAARGAGVNLAFFSGNEAFWRTRLEPSIAPDGGDNRTVVCYKMTKMKVDNNGIPDPSGQWTGTWMDPSGAGTGGNSPQNQITGTLFSVNGYRHDSITVGSEFKNMRLWRKTKITELKDGEVATFPVGTLGYEWDSDVENAERPPGAVRFSATTLQITDGTLLLDEGNNYGDGVATHSIVMYRDQVSKALVFGAGTVQWSWGLSTLHNGPASEEDPRMQQATANVLADMGAMPKTLQSNLQTPDKSTDTTGPAVNVTAPAAGATVPVLGAVTITGTASDTGGQLARVEVSTDNGTTWRAATGLGNWSYTWTPVAQGNAQIKVRGIDDSLNFGATTTVNVVVGPQKCPCTTYKTSDVPANVDSHDASPNELGAKFQVSVPATVTGVRFYKAPTNTGVHVGKLWTTGGKLLASGSFSNETASGWQTMTFSSPVTIAANTTYVVSYYTPTGHYSYSSAYFTAKGAGDGVVKQLQSGVSGPNGVYLYGANGGFPNQTWGDTNYWVDVVVDTSTAVTTPPVVTVKSPASGDVGVARNAAVTATFDHDVDPEKLAFTLKAGGTAVTAKVSYDDTTHKATLRPDAALAPNTAYTASVQATDAWGNAMPAATTWTFTTGTGVICPCTVFSPASTPDVESAGEAASLELGMRFTSDIDGYVTGVKFYKGDRNTGTHTGTLWTAGGQELATGTFQNETNSGWQTLKFATPVAIDKDVPYVVSYHTNVGFYSYSSAYFAQARSSYPLTGVADSGTGHNGLFKATANREFPTSSWNATNYWVDAIFSTTAS